MWITRNDASVWEQSPSKHKISYFPIALFYAGESIVFAMALLLRMYIGKNALAAKTVGTTQGFPNHSIALFHNNFSRISAEGI